MIAVGVDAHKERHYAMALDDLGQMLAERNRSPGRQSGGRITGPRLSVHHE
jgi:hypothetical protein